MENKIQNSLERLFDSTEHIFLLKCKPRYQLITDVEDIAAH
jgi:hypothetical protein